MRPLGTNFNEMLIKILTFSFTKMRLKVSSAKWHPFCLGLNVLKRSPIALKLDKSLVINVIMAHVKFQRDTIMVISILVPSGLRETLHDILSVSDYSRGIRCPSTK